MTYSLILKDTLLSGKIIHIVKYNDTKNYSFQYDTEQPQSVLDTAVETEIQNEKDSEEAVKKEEEAKAEAERILGG